jgi:hypothetical protein
VKELIRLASKMKDPDRFAAQLVRLGWGIVATFGLAQVIEALGRWL